MSASSIKSLNPNAEIMGSHAALFMNINAAKGLHDVMKSNLGPKGTIKMLVSGSGDIKMTKDGNVLLREMQIQNPTAVMIARTAVAQDDATGDGTTSTVLMIGELLKQAERHVNEGLHPRFLSQGFDVAKRAALEYLDKCRTEASKDSVEILKAAARTALRTKLQAKIADKFTDIVVEAVRCIANKETDEIDLNMVEIMQMKHKLDVDSRLVKGMVLDHGSRHPEMPKALENCHILTCNISLEYDKSEVNSGFYYSSSEQRERLVNAERAYVDKRVHKILDLKRKVCGSDAAESFVVVNQKGIDPGSLDLLAKENIIALRRAKRRNMDRITQACGGTAVTSEEQLLPDVLGWAGKVYEMVLGEEKFTFIEEVKNPTACTVVVKGPNDHTLQQLKDALKDGLRAVKNVCDDRFVVPGGGAFEAGLERHLAKEVRGQVSGRAKLGVDAFADAMLAVPKVLAENAGYDSQACTVSLQEEHDKGNWNFGLDVMTGEPCDTLSNGVIDNYIVKRQCMHSSPVIAQQLLLVDEVIRAGRNMRQQQQ